MKIINKLITRARRTTLQKVVLGGVFVLALAGATGLGLSMRQTTMAANGRDSGGNPINKENMNGGVGCLTVAECVADMKANKPGDLQAIYSYFGLKPSDYDDFLKNAKIGTTYKSGEVKVDGQVVMKAAWSMGREKFNSQRTAFKVTGSDTTYFKSPTKDSFASDGLKTFVLFNEDGSVKTAMLSACGNPVFGDNVKPSFECKSLTKTAVKDKKNTYTFKADVAVSNNASIVEYVFDFGDGQTKKSSTSTVEHTYTSLTAGKTYTASVKAIVKLPGGKSGETKVIANCKVTVEVPALPTYKCDALMAKSTDKKKYVFTAVPKVTGDATPKNADFTVNGSTVTGVATKDADGNFTYDYTLTQPGEYKVSAKIHFTVDGKDVVSKETCAVKVSLEKPPVCVTPEGKEYPVGAPECEEKPPVTPPTELPKTGTGSVVGLFTGVSFLGAAAHRVISSRRARRTTANQIDETANL